MWKFVFEALRGFTTSISWCDFQPSCYPEWEWISHTAAISSRAAAYSSDANVGIQINEAQHTHKSNTAIRATDKSVAVIVAVWVWMNAYWRWKSGAIHWGATTVFEQREIFRLILV